MNVHTNTHAYMMQGCHTPPPPPMHGMPPALLCGVGLCGVPFPAPPVVSLLWWAVHPHPAEALVLLPVILLMTRVDNRIIFDIMLNIIIVVVIFIISTIKEQLPPSPSPYNPHN